MKTKPTDTLLACITTATSSLDKTKNALRQQDAQSAFDALLTAQSRIEMVLTSLSIELYKTADWRAAREREP